MTRDAAMASALLLRLPMLATAALSCLLVLSVAAAVAAQGSTAPGGSGTTVRTVERVDLDRYLGSWYELARYPNRFQRQCVGDVMAEYVARPDGRLDVVNRCRQADGSTTTARGVARVVDTTTNARLKVRFAPAVLSFLPMVWGDYWVIGLAPDYAWALVGTPDRSYLWLLSRTPQPDEAAIASAYAVARANGFDTSRLTRTPQTR